MKLIILFSLLACLAIPSPAQTFTVLHDFELTDGQDPEGNLIKDPAGNLYGTTVFGGAVSGGSLGYGVVFRLSPSQNGKWTESVLHEFTGGTDGSNPYAGLTASPGGYGYGTAGFGGSSSGVCAIFGACGTVYRLNASGDFSVVDSFTGTPDGQQPFSPLLRDPGGNFFGTTELGGATNCPFNTAGCGVVYEVDASGKESVIYKFLGPSSSDGATPFAGLVRDAAGNLYGTTVFGGIVKSDCAPLSGCGTVFELSPDGSGGWTEKILYRFTGSQDGTYPRGLILGSDGNLYGTTANGGNAACGAGCGTVYELSQSGGTWTKTVRYSFSGGTDGANPSQLVQDRTGNFYGTTINGGDLSCQYGNQGCGVVFKFSPAFKETVLHAFSGTDGLNPVAGVLLDEKAQALYGTTTYGGDIANCSLAHYYSGCGVVFRVTK